MNQLNRISVVVPTHNRAPLLAQCLESLTQQTLSRDRFEVVVVNDGSTDETPDVCAEYRTRLQIRHVRIENSGQSAAKNLGLFLADAEIVFFFDDDDVADADLVQQHLQSHAENPSPEVAVLGWTGWSPALHVTEIMRYVIDVGQWLFAYSNLKNDDVLDFTYFWSGRSSCKKGFLARHGIFSPRMRFTEEIELGFRLSAHGLKVIFNRSAVSWMNRALTYDEFLRRCERQGRSLFVFARELHPGEPVVEKYCRIPFAEERWAAARATLDARVCRVRELELALETLAPNVGTQALIRELHELYDSTIQDHMLKGLMEATFEGPRTAVIGSVR
jgi:glycosyltransferase involved in cell wall biosynthesis